MKKTKIITVAAALTLSATLAFAGPGEGRHGKGGHHGRRGGEFGARFAEKLNLTDAQKEQIREINRNFREQNKPFFESSRATMQQFREAKKAGDQARIDALKGTLAAQRTQFQQLRDQQRQRVLSVLTAQQRAQYDALKAERAAKRQQRSNQ
ncbi:MAG TPA: Spy/CpxP family protein refolding chaperone [Thermoanaerobaculia bacterium]|jgi:Spy/CpxP family protein refolding chaperone